MLKKIKKKNIIAILAISILIITPYLISKAKFTKTFDVGSLNIKINKYVEGERYIGDLFEEGALNGTYDEASNSYSYEDSGLTITYLGDNTFKLNGTSIQGNKTYIRLTSELEILSSGDSESDVLEQIMENCATMVDVGKYFNLEVVPLGGTATDFSNGNVMIEFRTENDMTGTALSQPKYDFATGYVGERKAQATAPLSVATLYIGPTAVTFNDYTFRIDLKSRKTGVDNDTEIEMEEQLNNNLTIQRHEDGMYVLNGKSEGELYIRLVPNVVSKPKASELYDSTLASHPLFTGKQHLVIGYHYYSGTMIGTTDCSLLFRDCTTSCAYIPTPRLTTKASSTSTVFTMYDTNAVADGVPGKNVSQFALYIGPNLTFKEFAFYIDYGVYTPAATGLSLDEELKQETTEQSAPLQSAPLQSVPQQEVPQEEIPEQDVQQQENLEQDLPQQEEPTQEEIEEPELGEQEENNTSGENEAIESEEIEEPMEETNDS